MRAALGWMIAAAVAAWNAAPAEAAVFKVGPLGRTTGCTHARLSDAIAAAAANGAALDEIRLLRSQSETPEGSYYVTSQRIAIAGGYDSCRGDTRSGTSTLRSSGQGSVFVVAGASLELRYVELVGDRRTVATGGGIAAYGDSRVDLFYSRLRGLAARNGGAVSLDQSAGAYAPSLGLFYSTLEDNQAADEGGAVHCVGRAGTSGLVLAYYGSTLQRNAAARGGAAALHHCRWIQEGGVVATNRAARGGGIHATDGSVVEIRWDDWGRTAPEVRDNIATDAGGGLFLAGAGTTLSMRSARLDYNRIDGAAWAEGAALAVRDGAQATLERDPYYANAGRMTITGNTAKSTNPSPYAISVVAAQSGGTVRIRRAEISRNATRRVDNGIGGAILQASAASPESSIAVSNSVIANNDAYRVIEASQIDYYGRVSRGKVDLRLVSMQGNTVGALVDSVPVGSSDPLHTSRPLVHFAASSLYEYAPLLGTRTPTADSVFDCLLSTSRLNVAATRSLVADFIPDPFTYQPRAGYPGVDFCSGENLPLDERDYLGGARAVRDPGAPDRYGVVDVGAFEKQPDVLVIAPGG